MSLSRPLMFYAPQVTDDSKQLVGLEDLCRVCNNFKYCEDFERVHVLEGRRTPRTRIRGDAQSYTITVLTNHLLRDSKNERGDDALGVEIDDADRLRDCSYCRLMFDALNLFFKDRAANWREDAQENPTLFIQVNVEPGQPLKLDCQGAFIVYHEFTLVRAELEVFTLNRGSLTDTDFPFTEQASTEEEDSHIHHASEGFFRYWFRGCSGYRDATDQCYSTPNRLLYFDYDNDEVVLWECMSGRPGMPDIPNPIEYATLCHAWGNNDPGVPRLLKSNIDEWKEGRTISGLPAAIRDAARVSKINDLHFLFIDSMCILQDSSEDLRLQLPLVGSYFRDSILTIVAASAPTPDDAFLHPPKKDWVTKKLEFVSSSGTGVTMTLRRKYSRPETPSDALDKASHVANVAPGSFRRIGPLYGRHWCINEALLGTRIIHFMSGGIMGQCKRHDCTREGVRSYDRADWIRGMPERYGTRDTSELWLHVVEFHTSCDKLRGEDRLSKLSALASMSGAGSQDRYVAGLWWKSMTTGLLWEVKFRPAQTNTNTIKITLPFGKQKAPTFSWASVDTPVVWRDNYWTARPEARMVGCGSIPTHPEDPCGSVDGAWIRMEGFVLKCEVSQTLAGTGGGRWQFAYFRGKDDNKMKAYPFVGDGALAAVKFRGPLKQLRERHASKTRRRLRNKEVLSRRERSSQRTRAYLTRNFCEYQRNVLGPKTTRGMAFVLCIRQRGDYDEQRRGMVFDRWDGLVLTVSMRYPGAFERIGCIRDLPSTLLNLNDPFCSVTIV